MPKLKPLFAEYCYDVVKFYCMPSSLSSVFFFSFIFRVCGNDGVKIETLFPTMRRLILRASPSYVERSDMHSTAVDRMAAIASDTSLVGIVYGSKA